MKKEDKEASKIAEELRANLPRAERNKEVDVRKLFHKYFLKIQGRLNVKQDMEVVLWKHLVATKNDSPEKFETGIRNFGYKI
jgi:hypothetical protein